MAYSRFFLFFFFLCYDTSCILLSLMHNTSLQVNFFTMLKIFGHRGI